jgi:hypothetical protein
MTEEKYQRKAQLVDSPLCGPSQDNRRPGYESAYFLTKKRPDVLDAFNNFMF